MRLGGINQPFGSFVDGNFAECELIAERVHHAGIHIDCILCSVRHQPPLLDCRIADIAVVPVQGSATSLLRPAR